MTWGTTGTDGSYVFEERFFEWDYTERYVDCEIRHYYISPFGREIRPYPA